MKTIHVLCIKRERKKKKKTKFKSKMSRSSHLLYFPLSHVVMERLGAEALVMGIVAHCVLVASPQPPALLSQLP